MHDERVGDAYRGKVGIKVKLRHIKQVLDVDARAPGHGAAAVREGPTRADGVPAIEALKHKSVPPTGHARGRAPALELGVDS
jgi:hypothetical protein